MRLKKMSKIVLAFLAIGLLLATVSCTMDSKPATPAATAGTSSIGWGILEVRATDPPPANVSSAVVHLSNLEVHRVSGAAGESENASGWVPVGEFPVSFDLMSVVGVEQVLSSVNLTAGSFDQIRMDVTGVTVYDADFNLLNADVPGDKLKIVGAFNIGGGTKTSLTLDFDGEKSLVRTGEGKFIFKPVVKLLVNSQGKVNEKKAGGSGGM